MGVRVTGAALGAALGVAPVMEVVGVENEPYGGLT